MRGGREGGREGGERRREVALTLALLAVSHVGSTARRVTVPATWRRGTIACDPPKVLSPPSRTGPVVVVVVVAAAAGFSFKLTINCSLVVKKKAHSDD